MLDCGAPFGLADLLPLLGPLSRSPVLLLLLLLLYVLPRSRGTGPLVLGGSALLLGEPASAQDYAAAGAFVCVSCLYMFSSKIYL